MSDVADHYGAGADLSSVIAGSLLKAGLNLADVRTGDLAAVDEFHIRGRKATLELAGKLGLSGSSQVLDLGSGLGGPARTLVESYGCFVTGIDLTPAFCEAATTLSTWVGLSDRVRFQQGDATALPFNNAAFDAVITIHVAMNIAAKDRLYAEAHRVLKPGSRFAVYDVLQGEGGKCLYPVPWARTSDISHLATPGEMESLLTGAGFRIVEIEDSTDESQRWFEELAGRLHQKTPVVSFRDFMGADFPTMARNQVTNLRERRIRTVTYVCEA